MAVITAEKEKIWWKVVFFTQNQLHKNVEMVFINISHELSLYGSVLHKVDGLSTSQIPSIISSSYSQGNILYNLASSGGYHLICPCGSVEASYQLQIKVCLHVLHGRKIVDQEVVF